MQDRHGGELQARPGLARPGMAWQCRQGRNGMEKTMSRSFRKPILTDGYKGNKRKQFEKNQANKRVRKSKDIPNGKEYKKIYNSWDICDFKIPIDMEKENRFWRYNRK